MALRRDAAREPPAQLVCLRCVFGVVVLACVGCHDDYCAQKTIPRKNCILLTMIIIEQDAMLRVLNTANMLLPCHPRDAVPWITPSGRFSEANAALAKPPPSLDVKKHSNDGFCPDLLPLEADEDCISLSSCSSAASSSYIGRTGERRVSFAAPLVTDIRTRPRTKDCDKRALFYSSQETER